MRSSDELIKSIGNSAKHLNTSHIKENWNNLMSQHVNTNKNPYMLMGFLMSQHTKQLFRLQELRHGAFNVEHNVPFNWRQANSI